MPSDTIRDTVSRRAKVILVGAGPGDPGLITVKGLRVLQSADVIIHDRLAPQSLLEHAADGAEIVDAGKSSGGATMSQSQINEAMISAAKSGKTVCRLKGGDPFVFGRGGEEAIALRNAGVAYEVVPGVTSAIAVPASSGIPVTHRDTASACVITTGSSATSNGDIDEDYWRQVAPLNATLVVLMGAANIARITDALIRHGRDPHQLAAATQEGTLTSQSTVFGTLRSIADEVERAALRPPIVFTFGEVVSLADRIEWQSSLPLHRKRAVVSRARSSSSRLAGALTELGATVIETPAIRIEPLADCLELDRALDRVSEYDWLSFASRNAVTAVFERLGTIGKDARSLAGTKVAAIGPTTVAELRGRGIVADLVPRDYSSDGLLQAFRDLSETPRNVLAFKSDIGRESVMQGLTRLGAVVELITAYRTVRSEESAQVANSAYREGVDITTFTSSSTVINLLDMLGNDIDAVNDGIVACIGPITAGTARDRGLRVDIVPSVHTIDAMVDAITSRFAGD